MKCFVSGTKRLEIGQFKKCSKGPTPSCRRTRRLYGPMMAGKNEGLPTLRRIGICNVAVGSEEAEMDVLPTVRVLLEQTTTL